MGTTVSELSKIRENIRIYGQDAIWSNKVKSLIDALIEYITLRAGRNLECNVFNQKGELELDLCNFISVCHDGHITGGLKSKMSNYLSHIGVNNPEGFISTEPMSQHLFLTTLLRTEIISHLSS